MSVGSAVSEEPRPESGSGTEAEQTRAWQTQVETFVGREREMQTLRARMDDAKNGTGSLVLISGEPGIGKTRLLTEASHYAESQGLLVLWGHCWEGEGAPAFWPWVQILRRLLVEKKLPEVQKSFGSFRLFLGNDSEQTTPSRDLANKYSESITCSPTAQFQLFDKLSLDLRNVSKCIPIAVCIDDLHQADSDSLALVDFLAAHLPRTPLLVLGTYRTEEVAVRPGFQAFATQILRSCHPTRLELSGLNYRDAEKLAASHFATSPPKRSFVNSLYQRTRGNPFFIVETCRFDSERLSCPTDRGPGPATTIRAVIRARLQRLSHNTRSALQIAATLGNEFDPGIVTQTLGENAQDDWIDESVRHGFVQGAASSPSLLSFSHALVRDSLYLEVSRSDRKTLHKQIVTTLENSRNRMTSNLVDLLAHHSYAAGDRYDPLKTFNFLVTAGQAALNSLAHDRAVTHFQHALEVHDPTNQEHSRCDILLQLGEAQTKAGQWKHARGTFDEALQAARQLCSPSRLATAAIGLKGMSRGALPPDTESINALREALSVTPKEEHRIRSKLLSALSAAIYFDHSRNDAVQLADAAVVEAQFGDADSMVLGEAIEAQIFAGFRYDNTGAVLQHCNELERLGSSEQHEELIFRAKIVKYACLLQESSPNAVTELKICEKIAGSLRHPRYLWQVNLARASQALARGHLDEARRLVHHTNELGKRYHDSTAYQHLILLKFCEALLHQDYGSIQQDLESVVSFAPEYPMPRAGLALLHAARGGLSEASFTLAPIVHNGLAIEPDGFAMMTLCILATLTQFSGPTDWSEEVEAALRPYEGNTVTAGWGSAIEGAVSHFLAIIRLAHGDMSRALSDARNAVRQNRKMGFELLTARSSFLAAHCHGLLGQPNEQRDQLDMATSVFCSAGVPTPRLDFIGSVATHSRSPNNRHGLKAHPKPNQYQRSGDYWLVCFEGNECRMKHSRGLQFIHRLLSNQGTGIPSVELVQTGRQRTDDSNARARHEAIDDRALAEYRSRIIELDSEIQEAEEMNDLGRLETLRTERTVVTDHIASATGLHGRPRDLDKVAERARINVRNTIASAIRRLRKANNYLGRHFDYSIKTGRVCTYAPPTKTKWEL